MRDKKDTAFLLANCILPLLFGAFLYGLLSPDVFFMKAAGSYPGRCFLWAEVLPSAFLLGKGTIRQIRNFLPDMLWAYALVFALRFLMGQKEGELFKIFITSAVFSTVLELLQITSFVRGTFDFFDILLEVLAEAFAVFVIEMSTVRKWRDYEKKGKNSGNRPLSFPVRRDGTGKRRIFR